VNDNSKMPLDRSTVTGICVGLIFIGWAIFIGPSAAIFWNFPSLLIVGGGILATTLIRFPARTVLTTAQVVREAFFDRTSSPTHLVHDLARLAQVVRRDSLLAMERQPVSDPFLRRGVELCVDGVEPATVESMLRGETASVLENHERGQRILRGMGNSAPAFGMIGTLIGLVQMLTRMQEPSKIGGSMAVAMLTTFYGAFLAYLIFLPLSDKLGERTRAEMINREIVIQGLMAILAGYHPKLIERRLWGLVEPALARPKFASRPAASRASSAIRPVASTRPRMEIRR
jgi:chemotaxis protein MotA